MSVYARMVSILGSGEREQKRGDKGGRKERRRGEERGRTVRHPRQNDAARTHHTVDASSVESHTRVVTGGYKVSDETLHRHHVTSRLSFHKRRPRTPQHKTLPATDAPPSGLEMECDGSSRRGERARRKYCAPAITMSAKTRRGHGYGQARAGDGRGDDAQVFHKPDRHAPYRRPDHDVRDGDTSTAGAAPDVYERHGKGGHGHADEQCVTEVSSCGVRARRCTGYGQARADDGRREDAQAPHLYDEQIHSQESDWRALHRYRDHAGKEESETQGAEKRAGDERGGDNERSEHRRPKGRTSKPSLLIGDARALRQGNEARGS
ncbi:hypothetical protein C8J57DRAFT_1471803 [Mycena rebaudengoi]|nr:hypothetical protein C8J57DRAFT_1471803 [Mycena rebaudengoi]